MTRIGCSGFSESRTKYFRKFNMVEFSQSFIDLPQPRSAARWRQEAPPAFEFTMTAWQLITHPATSPTYQKIKEVLKSRRTKNYGLFQLTSEVLAAWERTVEVARALGARCILFLCPAEFVPEKTHIDNLTKFFGSIERGGLRMVWEPRARWPEDLVVSLCRDLDLVHCTDPFEHPPLTRSPLYVRLHGRHRPDGALTDGDFESLARLVKPSPQAYVVFANPAAWTDADRFRKMVQ
jgi:uncharacterized protein YecE (DUF72 family)